MFTVNLQHENGGRIFDCEEVFNRSPIILGFAKGRDILVCSGLVEPVTAYVMNASGKTIAAYDCEKGNNKSILYSLIDIHARYSFIQKGYEFRCPECGEGLGIAKANLGIFNKKYENIEHYDSPCRHFIERRGAKISKLYDSLIPDLIEFFNSISKGFDFDKLPTEPEGESFQK